MLYINDIIYIETPDYSSEYSDDYNSHSSIIHDIDDTYYYTHYNENGAIFRIKKSDVHIFKGKAYTNHYGSYVYERYKNGKIINILK